jgi:predicted enzyme related to lactoylglutathione lyase
MEKEHTNGAVIYVKDLLQTSLFYQHTLNFLIVQQEPDFVGLKRGNFELIMVKMPEEIASEIEISSPPVLREDTPIKLIFQVEDLDAARDYANRYGGYINAREKEWRFQNFQVCDGYDPEGNILQLRQAIQ